MNFVVRVAKDDVVAPEDFWVANPPGVVAKENWGVEIGSPRTSPSTVIPCVIMDRDKLSVPEESPGCKTRVDSPAQTNA